MKIPKQLKVGARNIKITFDKKEAENGLNGTSYIEMGEICLSPNNPPQQQEITFWHEIIHFILQELAFRDLSFENGKDRDEYLAKTLSHYFYQVLKDNNLLK